MRVRSVVVLGIASMIWTWLAQGQQQELPSASAAADQAQSEISTVSTDSSIKVRVNLVLLRVVVRDGTGQIVPGLKQDDFRVFDNGKRQKISAFNVETLETRATTATPEGTGRSEEPTDPAGKPIMNASLMPRRFLALVFDDIHMKTADAMAVHAATEKLFASLSPADRVAIYSTQGNVQQDFTSDLKTLRKTLQEIVPHPEKGEGQYECPNMSYYQADLIANKHDREAITVAEVDAESNDCLTDIEVMAQRILQAGDSRSEENYQQLAEIVKQLAAMPGQRVLVYVSPGFLQTHNVLQEHWEWVERAVRGGVVVNTIDARGLYTADLMPDIDAPPQAAADRGPRLDYQAKEGTYRIQSQLESGQVLAGIAASTGGRYFHGRNELDLAMNQALETPEVTYILGFRPEQSVADGKFHDLTVKVGGNKRYQIEATNGYYSSKKARDPDEAAKQEVREAFYSRDEIAGVPVQLTTQLLETDAVGSQLAVFTHLDISAVRFRKVEGASCDDILLATGLFDTNGRLVDGQMKEIALKLKDSTLEQMNKTGLTVKTVFMAKPGAYRVRSVLRDSGGDRLTARNFTTVISGLPPAGSVKSVSSPTLKWAPPKIDASLKSLSPGPCDLSEVLNHTGVNALALATNLERFTAQEHIDYVMLDRYGVVERSDSGTFQYVYSIEQQDGKNISREYRKPIKGSHEFHAADQEVGAAATALMFLPDLQSDYEMKCEGVDERNGQQDWVVHFEQRKDRPSRTAMVWSNGAAYPGKLKGRAWISKEDFQVVHLEARLMTGVPGIGLQRLAFSVDYVVVHNSVSDLKFWLPDAIHTYWDFDPHRTILDHQLSAFELFAVETKESVPGGKQP